MTALVRSVLSLAERDLASQQQLCLATEALEEGVRMLRWLDAVLEQRDVAWSPLQVELFRALQYLQNAGFFVRLGGGKIVVR